MKVLLVGSYPPPIGGNTVHIKRLKEYLTDQGLDVTVIDYLTNDGSEKGEGVMTLPAGLLPKVFLFLQLIMNTERRTIVHFHVSAMGRFKKLAPILSVIFWRQRRLLTIHSGSFIKETGHGWLKLYMRFLVRLFHAIISVNEDQRAFLIQLGFPARSIFVIPAYLPQKPDSSLVPQEVKALRACRKLVITSGYLTPTYDYETLIDCIAHLPSDYGFIFAFYAVYDPTYETRIYQRLFNFKNVLVLRDQTPDVFLSILNMCDIYVRTTLTDGDAVAVREAIHCGKQVFATDSIARPLGCSTFPTGDSKALLRLFNTPAEGQTSAEVPQHNGAKILEIYRQLYG